VAELMTTSRGDAKSLLGAQVAVTIVGGGIRYQNEAVSLRLRVGLEAKLPYDEP
jgi:hypothetical protein